MQLLLRITMATIAPPIWRLIRVPDRVTLHQLHRVLQINFCHLYYQLYAFQLESRRFEAPDPESEVEDATAIRLCNLDLSPGSQFTYIYDFGDGWEHNYCRGDRTSDAVGAWAGLVSSSSRWRTSRTAGRCWRTIGVHGSAGGAERSEPSQA